tara:strand:- start:259 stop:708 length:450 start_codon:yes stop_codon:yes gene_type:complete
MKYETYIDLDNKPNGAFAKYFIHASGHLMLFKAIKNRHEKFYKAIAYDTNGNEFKFAKSGYKFDKVNYISKLANEINDKTHIKFGGVYVEYHAYEQTYSITKQHGSTKIKTNIDYVEAKKYLERTVHCLNEYNILKQEGILSSTKPLPL